MALLIAQNGYNHVLRDRVYLLRGFHDPRVVLYGLSLCLDDALDHVHDVYLLTKRAGEWAMLGSNQRPLPCEVSTIVF